MIHDDIRELLSLDAFESFLLQLLVSTLFSRDAILEHLVKPHSPPEKKSAFLRFSSWATISWTSRLSLKTIQRASFISQNNTTSLSLLSKQSNMPRSSLKTMHHPSLFSQNDATSLSHLSKRCNIPLSLFSLVSFFLLFIHLLLQYLILPPAPPSSLPHHPSSRSRQGSYLHQRQSTLPWACSDCLIQPFHLRETNQLIQVKIRHFFRAS